MCGGEGERVGVCGVEWGCERKGGGEGRDLLVLWWWFWDARTGLRREVLEGGFGG